MLPRTPHSLSTMPSATSKASLTEIGLSQQDTQSRLPPYKSSYLGRFHPYGRKTGHARHRPIDLMKTIDLRYEPESVHRPSLALSIVTEEDEAEVINFNSTTYAPTRMEEIRVASNDPEKSNRLNEIVIDFVLHLCRVFSPRRSPKTT
ncbi:hypothetical protein K474DRAFT_1709369 [Panus rudis PR-1116 ss-1]|nr:hypothetical protein K474DRAFT_1709369 [Panus rudis PR-1116 ss-1]